jgi:hypothetical protein
VRRGLETFVAWEVGDFRREVDDSESEVSEEERIGEDESAFGIAYVGIQVWAMCRLNVFYCIFEN